MEHGARNKIHAVVTSVKSGDVMSLAKFDVERPCSMASVLTNESVEELGLKVVRLWTQSGNLRAVGSAQKLGFTIVARHREAIFKGGEYHDNISMDLLREEWYALHPELEDRLVDPFAGT